MKDRRYWQTVEEARHGLEPGAIDGELPKGAFTPPDEISRRRVLQTMGASLALLGGAACRRPVETIVPYVDAPERVVPGVPRVFASTMPLGTGAYGVLVESHENRPGKIEGNPLHPGSRGAASIWMQAATLELYDPDRSRRILHGEEESDWEGFAAAWEEMAADGARIAVLSGGYASPTLSRLRRELEERYPDLRWVVWDPVSDENVFRGWGGRPVYHPDRAEVLLTLDSDLLLSEDNALHNARGYGESRAVGEGSEPLRHYAVESALSVTGSNADHRIRLRSSRVPAFAAAVARELGVEPEGAWGELPDRLRGRARSIAADLRRVGDTALVAAGRRQPPAVHALVRSMNELLGAPGTTVAVHPLDDVGWSSGSEVFDLLRSLGEGEVDVLVMLGDDPVSTLPGLAPRLEEVPHSVYLGLRPDATAALSEWALPRAHWLESWGDTRAADGTRSVVQPLIHPLMDGIPELELLSFFVDGERRPGHDLVRETWRSWAPDEPSWRRVLHDGVLQGSASAGGAGGGGPVPDWSPPEASDLEVSFQPSRLWDGRFANNAWLQELPDPVTKLVWGTAALLSPATAGELGVETGDAVTLRRGEASVALPVLVLPGQADGSIAVELGHGRDRGGRIAAGVGARVESLRDPRSPWLLDDVEVSPGGEVEEPVSPQGYSRMAGRNLVREADLEEFRNHPETFQGHAEEGGEDAMLWPPPATYDEGYQWGMVIDLSRCIGCMACVTACQSENNIPVVGREEVSRGREMHWIRVDRYFTGSEEDPEVVFQPVPCMHCENAPCEQVCPVAATVHDSEGLNVMVYNRCIGTRYCSNNCPYKVRRFNFFNYTRETPELLQMAMNPDVTVRSRGVMEKCTYCLQRLSRGKREAKREGRRLEDGEVQTACQQTCPTDAILFGDLRDEEGTARRAKASPRNYVLLGDLNNRPRTSYLGKVRNPNPEWEDA